jgi:GNAT superfamily N-acetyltransferase
LPVHAGKSSLFFTLRMEHRRGGALARHDGEERVLLFRSDRAGAIAKIIFSSKPVVGTRNRDGDGDGVSQQNACHQYHTNEPRIHVAANAQIHVLFVKEAYRGFNLGGLLFVLCTSFLRERYGSRDDSGGCCREGSSIGGVDSLILCRLDAEEDVRRHDKLVHFYEDLGLKKRKGAKSTFINNNDGETYRRIPMNVDLLVPTSTKQAQPPLWNDGQSMEAYFSFLPALLVSLSGECARVDNRSIDSWLIVECRDGSIALRTTDGRMLTVDRENRCKLVPMEHLGSTLAGSGSLQLLRVSDMLDKVVCNREEEGACVRDKIFPKGKQENGVSSAHDKELWMLRSTTHGIFLGMTANHNLFGSASPSFWQADENFCLTHTSDSPGRRQHHRRMWATQSVAYASEMREKHSSFCLGAMTLEEALNLSKHLLANPFSMSTGEQQTKNAPSVRTLLFRTAELARKEGHPDWVQFVALVHGLAGVLTCLRSMAFSSRESPMADTDTGDGEDFEFDWTIHVDSRVLGCKASEHSTFAEFRHLNPDGGDVRYNTTNGLYDEHVGLENVLLSWTSSDYMYDMLKHNHVRLPGEAYSILQLFPLVDWHRRGRHSSLSNETDEELKPFVAEFYELVDRSRETMIRAEGGTNSEEMSDGECGELWKNHYSLIANKYGAGGILEW